jgi:alpha-1,2-mannosyltransferase
MRHRGLPRSLKLSRTTIALAALLIVHAVIVTAALHYALGVPRAETLAHHVDVLLTGTPGGDSWKPMATASRFAAEQPGASIYEEVFFRRGMKFQYPPSALLFTSRLERPALHLLSWLAVWITIIVSVYLFDGGLRESGYGPSGAIDAVLRLLIAAALAATFYPLVKAYSLGQIQVWIDALFALLVVSWASWARRPAVSGVCLGLICLIKPQFALIGIWAVVRRQWRFAAAGAAVVLAGLSVSVAAYGLQSHLDYLRVLTFISERGETFYANQSFNGLLNRLLLNGPNLEWQETAFPPPHRLVQAGTTLAALVLVAAAWLGPRRESQAGLFDLAIVALTATVVSPVAWEHHYGILLPLIAATAGEMLRRRVFGAYTAAALMLAFGLTGQFFQPLQRFAATPFNVLQSYVLFGALLLLALWFQACRLAPSAIDSRQPQPS